jgi:hypothetical protein
MGKRGVLTKILAIVGTVLVWLPVLAPFLFSVFHLVRTGRFLLDYLMPAELFPVVLVGGGLLLWAALRARLHRALIAGGLGAAVAFLVAGQALAVATGLASGEMEPAGFWWALVVATLALYIAGIVAVGVGAVLLVRDLFKVERRSTATA